MTTISPKKSYDQAAWKKGYDSLYQEYAYWIDDIEGTIPPELSGTLFRNGPGLLDIGDRPIKHPFDGDGMICQFTFKEGRAYFQNKFVKTEGYLAEQKARKAVFRGVFGTQKPGGFFANCFDLRLKNIANTNIIFWGEKLLALWEAAEPYRLDPRTLETIGLDYLDGVLKPGESFAAHPRIDPASIWNHGEPVLVNFAVKAGPKSTLILFEFDTKSKLLRRYEQSIPGFAFIHDFVITPHYYIFFQANVNFNPLPFLLGLKGAGECVQFNPDRSTKIILISRDPDRPCLKILEAETGFVFHHANAFEEGETVYVDSVCYQSIPQIQSGMDYKSIDFDSLDPGQLWRFKLDLSQEKVTRELLDIRCCEFPVIHPDRVGLPYRYVYVGATDQATGNAPLQAIWKLDLTEKTQQIYSLAPDGFANEPIFVPHPQGTAEDHGWLLALIYDSRLHRSDLVIFDAQNLTVPVATLHLKHHVPYGLHGSWSDRLFI